MAFRLAPYILYGELFFKPPWSVHGYLALRGWEIPLSIQLTGDAEPDLNGRHLRFEPAPRPDDEIAKLEPLGKFHPQQIGATGTMTADGWVKDVTCSEEEMLRRLHAREPLPFEWKRRLYLEWFGPNGRVVVELAGAKLEYNVSEFKGEEHEIWLPLPILTPKPNLDDTPPKNIGLGITVVRADGLVEHLQTRPPDEDDDDLDAPIPSDLQRRLDRDARRAELALRGLAAPPGEEDDDEGIAELELMDHLIENETGTPLVSLFDSPRRLPHPDVLDEEQAETVFKCLLGDLALCGIALHICEHFTAKQAYQLLVERIIQEGRAFKQLKGTGWTQNFSSSDYCPECEAETERDYKLNHEKYEQAARDAMEQHKDDLPFDTTDAEENDSPPF